MRSSQAGDRMKVSMNSTYMKYVALAFVFLNLPSAIGQTIDVSHIQGYVTESRLGWQYEVELDCESAESSFLHSQDIKSILIEQLKVKDIVESSDSLYSLKLAITDHSCNKNGENDEFVSPLALYRNETTYAVVILKVLFEIQEKSTDRILYSQEVVVLGNNEEEEGNLFWYMFDLEKKEVSLKSAWGRVVEEVVNKTKKVLNNV